MLTATFRMVLYKKVMKNMMRMVYTTRAIHELTIHYLAIGTTKYIVFQLNTFLQKDPPHRSHCLLETIPHYQVMEVLQRRLQ